MGRCNDCKCLIMRCFRGDRCKRCSKSHEVTEWEEHKKSGQNTKSEVAGARSLSTEENANAVLPGVLRNKIRILLKKMRELFRSNSVTKAKVPKLSFTVSVTDFDLGEYLSEPIPWVRAKPPDWEEGGASPTGDIKSVLSEDNGEKVEPVRMNASPFEQSETSQTTSFVPAFAVDFESAIFDAPTPLPVINEVVGMAHEQQSLEAAVHLPVLDTDGEGILEYLRTIRKLKEKNASCEDLNQVKRSRHNQMERLQRRRSFGDLKKCRCVPEQGVESIWLTESRERSSN